MKRSQMMGLQENEKEIGTKQIDKMAYMKIACNSNYYYFQAQFLCYFYFENNLNFCASNREGPTLLSFNNKLYLYGGLGAKNIDLLYEAELIKSILL